MISRIVGPSNKQSLRKKSFVYLNENGFENGKCIDFGLNKFIEGVEDYDSLFPDTNEVNGTSIPFS